MLPPHLNHTLQKTLLPCLYDVIWNYRKSDVTLPTECCTTFSVNSSFSWILACNKVIKIRHSTFAQHKPFSNKALERNLLRKCKAVGSAKLLADDNIETCPMDRRESNKNYELRILLESALVSASKQIQCTLIVCDPEWMTEALHSTFLNINRSGVFTAYCLVVTWLVPRETALQRIEDNAIFWVTNSRALNSNYCLWIYPF